MTSHSPSHADVMKNALQQIRDLKAKVKTLENDERDENEAIAIVGMSCRLPQGNNTPEQFWEFLRTGGDATGPFTPDRWDTEEALYGAFIDDVVGFDPQFFNISPREAVSLDPQQRLLLEVAWEALERANIVPEDLMGTQAGVFVGISGSDYEHLMNEEARSEHLYGRTGVDICVAAGRLSYVLGLTGPSLSIDTACSSSLVAFHQACLSLRQRECHLAITGGVGLTLRPEITRTFSGANMLAADGRCKSFDASADGYVRGEGCGVLILKRLSDAMADGDSVLALIRGSMINQDGPSSGLTAPRGLSQQAVIQQALKKADIPPHAVDYVEAHGTGTPLGDPIEMGALKEVFQERSKPLWVGSVKTNIGHLEAAAGVAALIKVVLMVQNQQIAPHLHFENPNPHIDWDGLPVEIPKGLTPWDSKERIAGVSSFGYSGTNAHLIVSEAPDSLQTAPTLETLETPHHLFTLSAKSEEALLNLVHDYQSHLSADSTQGELADLCYTAQKGRSSFSCRLAVVCESIEQLKKQLAKFSSQQGALVQGLVQGNVSWKQTPPKTAFCFTGQGPQYLQMGRQLYDTHPLFRETMEQCDALLQPHLGQSILQIMYPDLGEGDAELLDETQYTQPALFSLEYSLAQLWISWGVKPKIVMGHSAGELVAACVAGVFNLEAGIAMTAARGRLMQALPQEGIMMSATMTESEAKKALVPYAEHVSIASINSPEQLVLSGQKSSMQSLQKELHARDIETRDLKISIASHCPLMEPILEEFQAVVAQFPLSRPSIPLVSNITGKIAGDEITKPSYWSSQIRQPVQFSKSINTLYEAETAILMDLGPHSTLAGMSKWQETYGTKNNLCLPSMRKGHDDWQQLLKSLGELYVRGVSIDWHAFEPFIGRKKVTLPTYPFQRQPYWIQVEQTTVIENKTVLENKAAKAPLLQRQPDLQLHRANITQAVLELMAQLLLMDTATIDLDMPFIEMGSDSVIVVEALAAIEQAYGIKLTIRQLFEELNTVSTLAEYISAQVEPAPLPEETPPIPEVENSSVSEIKTDAISVSPKGPIAGTELERIFQQQLQTTQQIIAQQLAVLGGQPQTAEAPPAVTPQPANPKKTVPPSSQPKVRIDPISNKPLASNTTKTGLNENQQKHLDQLVTSFTARTKTSKHMTEQHRSVLADSRASVGFRPSFKEMLYPIVGERSQGTRVWDVDGNEYIDFMMGFGVCLFGHQPDFVKNAVQGQIDNGESIGPRPSMVGQVAQLFTEITGHDRVVFANTGTEAVMTAIRLARAVTGKNTIVMFDGSYHGHSDLTALALSGGGEQRTTVPVAPGIPENMTENVLILEYDNPQSLETIRAHANDLAGVIVEPVQCRHPTLQPHEFLKNLRTLTTEIEVPLIFDEMITGFRLHPQGAQGWFGVQADLAAYGKAVGGGFPIGVVAGQSKYLDGIDGGMWQYGDASFPQVERTFFGGTFCQHPVSMAAALAVLQHLKEQGPELQTTLNTRTAQFAQKLNAFFTEEEVPMEVVYCGSLFRFQYKGNLELFFYHLLHKGIFVGEWRACFLSTAHTDADLEKTFQAIQETIETMRAGGILAERKKKSVLPLTDAQRQLWLLHQMGEKGSLAYHERHMVEFKGELDLQVLQQAVQHLVERHEALRLCFSEDGQTQKICSKVSCKMPTLKLREDEVLEWLNAESQQVFNFEKGPLFRTALLQLEADKALFVMTAHHIIVDGASIDLLFEDLTQIYSALVQGQMPSKLRAAQYHDFVNWLVQQYSTDAFEQQANYWLENLQAPLPILDLPIDHVRPQISRHHGGRHSFLLDTRLSQMLKKLGNQQGCTVFTTCFAAYLVLLHRLTGQDDLIVGIHTSGRDLENGESIVGYCTHMLPIRSQWKKNNSFVEHLKQTQSLLLDAYDHGGYPYASLLNRLDLPRDASRPPLINTTFNLDKPRFVPSIEGMVLDFPQSPRSFYHFDLGLNIMELPEHWEIDWNYNSDILEADTVERWACHFVTLLKHVVDNSGESLTSLPLLDSKERYQILDQWNTTEAEYPKTTIHQQFEQQVEQSPEATALVFDQERLSYRELNSRANQLAHHLRTLGVVSETLVGLCMDRSLEMLIGLYGILKAGGAYVPFDPGMPSERLMFMIQDAAVPIILTQKHLLSVLPESEAQVVCLDKDWPRIAANPCTNPDIAVDPQHLMYVMYTSGSTGTPKGVMNEHGALVNSLAWMQETFALGSNDHVLQKTPFSFDVSLWELFWPLLVGARLVIAMPEGHKDPQYLKKIIETEQITTIHFVPSMLQTFLDSIAFGQCLNLQRILCIGEALPSELQKQCFAKFPLPLTLHNLYGPTEAAVQVSHWHCERESKEASVPMGRPIANTQLYIFEQNSGPAFISKQDLGPVPIGVIGELYIGGIQVARGYHNRPELTKERFIDNPWGTGKIYRTGDLALYRPDGSIEYVGRVDQQIKLRGFRIELGEIEVVLGQQESVQEAAVLVLGNAQNHQQLVAFVVPHEVGTHSLFSKEGSVAAGQKQDRLRQNIQHGLQQRLPDYMVPNTFVFMDTLPLTNNGKIDRNALLQEGGSRVLEGLEYELNSNPFEVPQGRLEEQLAQIWAEVLKKEKVGRQDNFFALGGDSMSSIQILTKAREFDLDFSLSQIFQHQTVASLASVMQQSQATTCLKAEPFGLLSMEEKQHLEKKKIALEDAYPLTSLQAGMVFHSEFSPESAVYHDIMTYQLQAPFEPLVLHKALERLVARHPILRTRLEMDDLKQALQCVLPEIELPIGVEDLSHLPVHRQKLLLTEWIEAEKRCSFDWQNGPLWRIQVHLWDKGRFNLSLSFHHAILDGWSVALMMTELLQDYDRLCQQKEVAPPPLESSFRDFVAMEQQTLASSEIENFWSTQLEGHTFCALPRWNEHKETPVLKDAQLPIPLSLELTDGLKAMAQQAGVPLKSVLLAGHLQVLGLLTSQDDVLTGLVTNGRLEEAGGNEVLGLFLNTLPFRLNVSGKTWVSLVQDAFAQEQAVFPNRRYPYADLKNKLKGSLFEACFNYTHFHVYQELEEAENVKMLDGHFFGQTNFVFLADFNLNEETGLLELNLEYDATELCLEQVQKMGSYYCSVLQAMVSQPNGLSHLHSPLSNADRSQILVEWNDTAASFPQDQTIHQLFENQVKRSPDAIAVRFENQELSYRQLDVRANQLAHHLRSKRIVSESRIGIYLERSLEMVVALYAVLKSGGAYVPFDPSYPDERLAFMVEDAGVAVIVTESSLAKQLPKTAASLLVLDQEAPLIESCPTTAPKITMDAAQLMYVIYTSGSTGKPKGAMNCHQAVVNRLSWMQKALALKADDCVLQKTPFSFDVSVWEFFWPLMVGAKLVIAKPEGHKDPHYLAQTIEKEQITTLHFVPSMLQVFLNEVPGASMLRQVICSGEALSFDLQEQFYAQFPRPTVLHNLYGPTEAAIDVTHWRCERESTRQDVPIGRPIANTQIYLLNAHQQVVPIGVQGELYIGGIQVGRGYLNRPELTEEKFIPNPFGEGRLYRTGDLARYCSDGNIEYLGRMDHQVKIRGVRIELGEIEGHLVRHPDVQEAVAHVVDQAQGQVQLVAYVLGKVPNMSQTLRLHLSEFLPEAMVPSAFVSLEHLPLTANGKLNRRALPPPVPVAAVKYQAARNEIENHLINIWEAFLKVETVGVYDNFFELGGDSIISIQVVSRAKQVGIEITPKAIFQDQTIARLALNANWVETLLCEQGPVVGEVPLTPIQHYFFKNYTVDVQHFNQATCYEIKADLDLGILEQAFQHLMLHHDALRARFSQAKGQWKQHFASPAECKVHIEHHDRIPHQQESHLTLESSIVEGLQAGMDLQQGPLMRVAWLDHGPDQAGVLVWVIHHLIVDGVSWRVLVEDLNTVYQQIEQGEPVELEPKTHSYQEWATVLQAYAQSKQMREEQSYWDESIPTSIPRLPVDQPFESQHNTVASEAQILVSLTAQETQTLLKECHAVYHTQINDLLLTALAMTFCTWMDRTQIVIDLESHGRASELKGSAQNKHLDLSRTVGWFTSLYPVCLEIGSLEVGEALKSIKEQLRKVPHYGVGYGILHHLKPEDQASQKPEVVFNYLGQFDNSTSLVTESTLLQREIDVDLGHDRSLQQQRTHLLEINCWVADNRFQVAWNYSKELHQTDTIEHIAQAFTEKLRSVMHHCLSSEAGGFTPSDFDVADLNQGELDDVLSELDEL